MRANVLLQGQGLKKGSVGERLAALAKDPRWLYPDDEAGRDRAVADMNAAVAALRPRLALAFGDLPVATAQARRMSATDVAAGKGGYRETGAYYVDLRNIRARPIWTLPSAAFHEVIPGHLLQMPLQAAAAAPAERVKAAGAYFEAWAIYAEQLAADLGAYGGDPRGELGYLQWRLFRLGRVVVDTGLHALGWSRDQAIAAMTDLQGRSDRLHLNRGRRGPHSRHAGEVCGRGAGGLVAGAVATQGASQVAGLSPGGSGRWPVAVRRAGSAGAGRALRQRQRCC